MVWRVHQGSVVRGALRLGLGWQVRGVLGRHEVRTQIDPQLAAQGAAEVMERFKGLGEIEGTFLEPSKPHQQIRSVGADYRLTLRIP